MEPFWHAPNQYKHLQRFREVLSIKIFLIWCLVLARPWPLFCAGEMEESCVFRNKSAELPDPFDFQVDDGPDGSKESRRKRRSGGTDGKHKKKRSETPSRSTDKSHRKKEREKDREKERVSRAMLSRTDAISRKKRSKDGGMLEGIPLRTLPSHSSIPKSCRVPAVSSPSPLLVAQHAIFPIIEGPSSVLFCKKVVYPEGGVSPPPRAFPSVTVVGSKMVVFGGKGSKLFRDLWTFDSLLQVWEHPIIQSDCEDIPSSRYRGTVTNVSEQKVRMFLYGGQKRASKICPEFHEIVVEEGCFRSFDMSECASPSYPFLAGHTAVLLNDKIYFFGGQIGVGKKSNQLAAFCPRTMSWTFFPLLGSWPQGRDSHSTVSFSNSTMYMFGGYNGQNYLNDLWMFDLDACVWSLVKPEGDVPQPRGDAAACVIFDRYILLTHGRDDDIIFGDFFLFDTVTKHWECLGLEGKCEPRYGHTLNLLGKEIFMYGGFGYDETFGDLFVLTFQENKGLTASELSPVQCNRCPSLTEKLTAAEARLLDQSLEFETEIKRLKNDKALLASRLSSQELKVGELERANKSLEKFNKTLEEELRESRPKRPGGSTVSSLAPNECEDLSLDEISELAKASAQNLLILEEAAKSVKLRANRKRIANLLKKENQKQKAYERLDQDVAERMIEMNDPPPKLRDLWPSGRGILRRQYYLIPTIRRRDDYSCRTEASVNSGDDTFATEEWLLSRPSEWHTNPNWNKLSYGASRQKSRGSGSGSEKSNRSLKVDIEDFCGDFLRIAQSLARLQCEIPLLWKRGIVVRDTKTDISFLMEITPDNQLIDISFDFKDSQKDFRIFLHIDEMLDHWAELFPGYEWLKYAVEMDGDTEDLIPIQSIHLAMADSNDSVTSINLEKEYEITRIAPDLLLPSDMTLKFQVDFQIGRQIGKGGFANIYEGKYKRKTVAVKMCNVKAPIISQFDSEEEKEAKEKARHRAAVRAWRKFWHEVMVLYEMRGEKGVLQLLGYSREPFCIVTCFLPHGDLYHLLQNEYQYRTIPYVASLKFALSAAESLGILHSRLPAIIHNDFKSPNMFLDVKNHKTLDIDCYLGDFGCARRCFAPILSKRRLVANPGWLAPEQLMGKHFDEKVDVYSFGVYLHELLSRQHPFSEYRVKDKLVFEEKIVGGLRPTIPAKWPLEFRELISDCWQNDPDARPTFEVIVERLKMELASVSEEK